MLRPPIEILLVEDSAPDVWLMRQTLMEGPVPKNIHVVTNGEQALDYLEKKEGFTNAPRPDVVLLDLNLPRQGGLDVLRAIKDHSDLQLVTVIVLSTSARPSDVNTAYDLQANCYVVKPLDLEEFVAAIRAIEDFWMELASLPTMAREGRAGGERADPVNGGAPAASSGG